MLDICLSFNFHTFREISYNFSMNTDLIESNMQIYYVVLTSLNDKLSLFEMKQF